MGVCFAETFVSLSAAFNGVQAAMRNAVGRSIVVFMDACRLLGHMTNPHELPTFDVVGEVAGRYGARPLVAAVVCSCTDKGAFSIITWGRLSYAVSYASGATEAAFESDSSSLFTLAMMDAIQTYGDAVPLSRLVCYIRDGVSRASGGRQVPWTHSSSGAQEIFLVEQFRHHRALVIGCSRYSEAVGSLAHCVQDAAGMAAVLRSKGCAVSLVTNCTREQLGVAFEWFLEALRDGCSVIVFFSGHGLGIGRGTYLVPSNGDGECRGFSSLHTLIPTYFLPEHECAGWSACCVQWAGPNLACPWRTG
jgi:hypothetical protein